MNERIRELAIQAGDDWNQTLPSDREFLHKFAELVREDERQAIWDILINYASRDDLSDDDESLLLHLGRLIQARSENGLR
jgi:hypothetical protein